MPKRLPPRVKEPLRPEHLTTAEKLYLTRKRAGLRMDEMAADIGVPRHAYSQMERGLWPAHMPYTTIRNIYENECFTILRKRSGMTLQQLAVRLGCTASYVSSMESGGNEWSKLTWFWLCGGDKEC